MCIFIYFLIILFIHLGKFISFKYFDRIIMTFKRKFSQEVVYVSINCYESKV